MAILANTGISESSATPKSLHSFIRRLWSYADSNDTALEYRLVVNMYKLRYRGGVIPGDKVTIYWSEPYNIIDYGYIFTLPTPNNHDIFVAGVVHIPNSAEDTNKESQWWILPTLMALPAVRLITFGEVTE